MPVELRPGDCRDVLRAMPDASVDSVVTDPPYALVSIGKRFGSPDAAPAKGDVYARASAGFMGKQWDTGEVAFAVEFWREVYRVLKPGGHVVAFAGSRTYHRLAVAIEDAGFEIRDQLMWLYGSGFPKSHDVSKGIDKLDAAEARLQRRYRFTTWFREACELDKRGMDALCGTNDMGRHWTDVPPNGKQPDVPTREHFEKMRPHVRGEIPAWVEALVDERTVESENFKRREVLGEHEKPAHAAEWRAAYDGGSVAPPGLITAPATPEAAAWAGWGTALKPAHEPIVLARKPLDGTVAANVLAHGVGALNIDATRVPPSGAPEPNARRAKQGDRSPGYEGGFGLEERAWQGEAGRWPANVLHDGSDEVEAAFAAFGESKSRKGKPRGSAAPGDGWGMTKTGAEYEDAGSPSRFFYAAKASRADRAGSKHPTVKPVSLMRWLVRLVTPPGGLVLDPFAGSGTTGQAAHEEGFRCILVEREAEYQADIRARLEACGALSRAEPVANFATEAHDLPADVLAEFFGEPDYSEFF